MTHTCTHTRKHAHVHACTHTHYRFTTVLDFVWDYPGEPVPER